MGIVLISKSLLCIKMDILNKLNPGQHRFEAYYPRCRDKEIPVYKCVNTGALALQQTHKTEYEKIDGLKYWSTNERDEALKKCKRDDTRRRDYIKQINPNTWLDVGSGAGGIFEGIDSNIKAESVEPMPHCQRLMPVKTYSSCNDIENIKKYDLITSFHVVEHLEDPLGVLQNMKSHLAAGGKCIIEVPHANDFLLRFMELESFKEFTFWSQHLILHTEATLRWLLEKSGFTNINIKYIQRYSLSNHMYWLRYNKCGGHQKWPELDLKAYDDLLKSMKMTDTLLAYAE